MPGKEPVRLVGDDLIGIKTLELVVHLGRDHGLDSVMVADVMFRTILEQLVLCVGPEAAVEALLRHAVLVQRAALSVDTHGLSEMRVQGEA